MFQDYHKSFGLKAYQDEVLSQIEIGSRIEISAPTTTSFNSTGLTLNIPGQVHQTLPSQVHPYTQSLAQFGPSDVLQSNGVPIAPGLPASPQPPLNFPSPQPTMSQHVTSSSCSTPSPTSAVTFPPNRSNETDRGRSLAHRVIELESTVLMIRGKYEKQIEHYKTRLCSQVASFSHLKDKAKKLKEECEASQNLLSVQNKIKDEYTKALELMEEERRQRFNEKQAKSVESKRLLMAIRAELEQQKQANMEAKSQIMSRTREKEDLSENLSRLQREIATRDENVIHLKKDIIDVTQKYKITQQHLVEKAFKSVRLKLIIAHANCEAQINERSRQANPELYNLSKWKVCQDDIRQIIEKNRQKYDRYFDSLHQAEDPVMISFEEEPLCPEENASVPVLPIQRFDELLSGRVPPPLPRPTISGQQPARSHASTIQSELESIASTFNASSETASGCSSPFQLPLLNGGKFEYNTIDSIGGASVNDQDFSAGLATLTNQLNESHISIPTIFSNGSGGPSSHSQPVCIQEGSSRGRGRGRNKRDVAPTRQPQQLGAYPTGIASDCVPSSTPDQLGIPNIEVPLVDVNISDPSGGFTHIQRRPNSIRDKNVSDAYPQTPPDIFQINAQSSASSQKDAEYQQAVNLKTKLKKVYPYLLDEDLNRYLEKVNKERPKRTEVFQMVCDLIKFDQSNLQSHSNSQIRKHSLSPNRTCVICLEDLELGDKFVSGCVHKFHQHCVDLWFATSNFTCPLCRNLRSDVSVNASNEDMWSSFDLDNSMQPSFSSEMNSSMPQGYP